MEANYNYMSSTEYFSTLTFDPVETYSFQRGKGFEENLKLDKPEYEWLKVRKERRDNLKQVEDERFVKLHELLGFGQY